MTGSGDTCFVISSEGSGNLLCIDTKKGVVIGQYQVGGSCAGLVVSGTLAFLRDNKGILRALEIPRESLPAA